MFELYLESAYIATQGQQWTNNNSYITQRPATQLIIFIHSYFDNNAGLYVLNDITEGNYLYFAQINNIANGKQKLSTSIWWG